MVSRDASRRFGLSPASHHQAGLSKSAVPACYTARCCFICFLKCFMYCFVFGGGRYRERLVFSSVITACKIKSVLCGFHLFVLLCVFVVLPHRASPLYTLDSPACILPRRYCTRNLLPVTVIRQVLAFTLLQALLQALLDILIVTHTHGISAHCQYSLALCETG